MVNLAKLHPMEELLLYTARKLREQYFSRSEEHEFIRLINNAEQSLEVSAAGSKQHEQGKLPKAPAAPAADAGAIAPVIETAPAAAKIAEPGTLL